MDELRRRLADLDRVAVPDHWAEVERRAWARSEGFEPASTLAPRTRWIRQRRSPEGSRRMFTPIRVMAVSLMTLVSASLLAVSFSSPGSSPGQQSGGPGSSPAASVEAPSQAPLAGPAIAWDTGCVQLTADSLRITTDLDGADRQVFSASGALQSLVSDPGDETRRTLEATWHELGTEVRLNLYLAADATSWWISELRTDDGQPIPDWITYPGPLFETPLGEAFHGDVALESADGAVPGAIEIGGLSLTVPDFGPGSGPHTQCWGTQLQNAQTEATAAHNPAATIDPDKGDHPKTSDMRLTKAQMAALDAVQAELLEGCFGREEGVARLTSALVDAGASGFFVRTDGPVGGPSDRIEEITAHVDAGCVVYGGSGATADGTRIFYIGGGTGTPTSTFIPASGD